MYCNILCIVYKACSEYDTEIHTEKSNDTEKPVNTTLKSFRKDYHTEIISFITLKCVIHEC